MAKTDFTRDQTINIAVKMGKILLKSGAETYRVEDTISRCCLAHGYEVDPFVTPTVIILGNEDTDSFIRVSLRRCWAATAMTLLRPLLRAALPWLP